MEKIDRITDAVSFDITPDVRLIKSMGQKGYKFWQAISELVDNAIDARREDIKPLVIEIHVDQENPKKTEWIEVRDYGRGMTYPELEKCMKLAYVDTQKKDEKKLGRFGLGLKTAASSLGSKFIIKTKHYENENEEVFTLIYDESKFIKEDRWEISPTRKVDDSFKPGTLIRIEQLSDRGTTVYSQKMERLMEMFSMQYGPYIQSGELKIKVDTLQKKNATKDVEPYEYDLQDNKRYQLDFKVGGRPVKGWFGFLKVGHKGVSKGFSGFNLFWKNRLVAAHQKIGYRHHPESWRFVGELHLDDFPVTNDKKDFIWNHELMVELVGPEKGDQPEGTFDFKKGKLYEYTEKQFDEFENFIQQKRDLYKRLESENIPLPEIKELKRKLKKEQIPLIQVKKELESVKAKYEKKIAAEEIDNEIKKEEYLKEFNNLKEETYDFSSPIFKFNVIVDNKQQEYEVFHETKSRGGNEKAVEIERKENKIFVLSNVNHPSMKNYKDLVFIYDLQKIEGITWELMKLKKIPETINNFFETRDKIWIEYNKQKKFIEEKKRLEEKSEVRF